MHNNNPNIIKSIKYWPFWVLSIAFVIILTLPTLVQDGMFMDAELYTSVSHNLANGIGSFWFPQFSKYNVAGLSSFHEQPPLVFGIQSLFFKVFGDSMYVERGYTFLLIILTVFLIIKLWNIIFQNQPEYKKVAWLPVLFWITIPVCFWSYSYNMHENTMAIFTLLAVITIYKSTEINTYQAYVYAFLSGIFVFLASLSKGVPGFFPIVVPFLVWLITKKIPFKKTIILTLIVTSISVVVYLILFSLPKSKESLSIYLFQRLLQRINDLPTTESRFFIVYRLAQELMIQYSLVGVILIYTYLKKYNFKIENKKTAILFILIGLAGALPLMMTMVQKGFYCVPSFPFIAIGLAVLITPQMEYFMKYVISKSKAYNGFKIGAVIILITALVYSLLQVGKICRDQLTVYDTHLIGKVVPKHSTVSIYGDLWNDWSLQCYLSRYYFISMNPQNKQLQFYLKDQAHPETVELNQFKKLNLPLKKYELYIRK